MHTAHIVQRKLLIIGVFSMLWATVAVAQTGSWQEVRIADNMVVTQVRFIDSLTGYAMGATIRPFLDTEIVLNTTDGGFHWTAHPLPSLDALSGAQILYAGNDGLIIMGNVPRNGPHWKIFSSYDGGESFTVTDTDATGNSFSFWSGNDGVRSGFTIARTSDGGRTWKQLPYNYTLDAFAKSYASGSVAVNPVDSLKWLVFPPQTTDGLILSAWTTDGGMTWQDTALSVPGWIGSGNAEAETSERGLGILSSATYPLLTSPDVGEAWTPTLSFPPATLTFSSGSLRMFGLDTLLVLGWDTASGTRVLHLWRSTNRGSSWRNEFTFQQPSFRPADMFFTDSAHGWVVGDSLLTQASENPTSAYLYIYRPSAPMVVDPSGIRAKALTLYPNPATRQITIEGAGGSVEIEDALGRAAEQVPVCYRGSTLVCDIGSLPAGVYVARVGPQAVRFVKTSTP